MKRIVSWEEYFMGLALFSAMRSKDPRTRVGCCIVNQKNRVVAIGYNGMPNGCNDADFPWDAQGEYFDQKYAYVVHAELNAILNATTDVNGCSLYTVLFPCNECCKAIIQSGIKEVIYLSDKYAETDSVRASKRMFSAARVSYREYTGQRDTLSISFDSGTV